MSYHVLHVLQHGSLLSKDRGFLVCESEGRPSRKLPFEDVRAVVIAARGVTLTSNFVSAILDSNGIILHCDESYQPCGISVPLARIVDLKSFQNQTAQPARLNANLWQRMLHYKTRNQHGVLAARKLNSPHLERAMKSKFVDEANCAKRYWQLYFPSIGWISTGRDRKEQTPPNQMLNYGYAVLSALCHRSLIIHGLSPQLGINHKPRFHSDPLVYDVMEPFRPIVDLMLAEFMMTPDISMKAWCRKVGGELRERRVSHDRYSLKLMDAIDVSVESLARSYRKMDDQEFWCPVI